MPIYIKTNLSHHSYTFHEITVTSHIPTFQSLRDHRYRCVRLDYNRADFPVRNGRQCGSGRFFFMRAVSVGKYILFHSQHLNSEYTDHLPISQPLSCLSTEELGQPELHSHRVLPVQPDGFQSALL